MRVGGETFLLEKNSVALNIVWSLTQQYFQITAEKKKIAQAEEEARKKVAKEEGKDQEEGEDKEKEKEQEKEGEQSSAESSSSSSGTTEQQREAPVSRVVADTTAPSPSTKSGEAEADSSYTEPEEDPIVAATKQTHPNDSKIGTFEKIFSVLSIDRALCLLGAILPQELSVSNGGKDYNVAAVSTC